MEVLSASAESSSRRLEYRLGIGRNRRQIDRGESWTRSYRLKPGRHGLSPGQVRSNQRWRLLGACSEVLGRRGYAGLTVREVVSTAGISKADFYRSFPNLQACALATYEMAADALSATSQRASKAAPAGGGGLVATVAVVLDWLEEERNLALLLADPALLDVPGVADVRRRLTVKLGECLCSIQDSGGGSESGQSLQFHLVGGARVWVAERLRFDRPAPAVELTKILQAAID